MFNTPTYKLVRFVVAILNENSVKKILAFAEELAKQQSGLFRESVDIDSLFTNILLKEYIKTCTNTL